MLNISLKSIFFIYSICIIIDTIGALASSETIMAASSGIELAMMFGLLFLLIIKGGIKSKHVNYLIVFFLISVFHFIIADQSDFPTYLKLICPLVFFLVGYYTVQPKKVFNEYSNLSKYFIVFCICILPLLLRLLQLLTGATGAYYSIFVNSNNFAYYVIISCIFIYYIFRSKAAFFIYLVSAIVLSKTLGALFALSIAFAIVNRRKVFTFRNILIMVIVIPLGGYLIFFSNISLFQRLRDTITTYDKIRTSYSISSLNTIEYSDASKFTQSGADNLSFLFRIKNWSEIIVALGKSDITDIIFGHGLLSVPKITSTGLVAHNDYLGIFYEMGLLFFVLIIIAYFKLIRLIKDNFILFAFLAIAIFHFTENLYYNFLVTSLHFLLLGLITSKNYKDESIAN